MFNFHDPFDLLYLVVVLGLVLIVASLPTWLIARLVINLWATYQERETQRRTRRAEATIAEANAERAYLDNALVHPNLDGLLPIARAAVMAATPQLIEIVSQYQDRMRTPANVPQTMNYAPHIRDAPRIEAAQNAEAPQPPALAMEIDRRDWWQLYHADELPDDGYMLGWDMATGEKIVVTWEQLYNLLVGGLPRSGKSTLIRGVLAQAAMQGSKFVVLDKHFGAGEDSMGASLLPLRPLMLTDIAATEAQMLDALRLVRNVAEARLSGRDKDKTPLILVTDETTGLLVRSNIASELINLLGLLTQESAKVKVFVICIGHQWKNSILPTDVRNSFVSSISSRARQDTARIMSGSNEFAKIAADLKMPGEAVWMTPAGDIIRLAIPNCTAHHVELVARQVTSGVWSVPSPALEVGPGRPPGHDQGAGTQNGDESALADDEAGPGDDSNVALVIDPTRAALVKQLFKAGTGRKEIIAQVWRIEPKAGTNSFKTAARELDEILRALIR